MKKIFLLIILHVSLFSSEHTIIFHGFTHHFDRTDKIGRDWNEISYGIGYEYSTYVKDSSDLYYTFGANIIKDSNSEIFPFISAGLEIRPFSKYFAFSLTAIVGYKVFPTFSVINGVWTEEIDRKYEPIVGASPSLKFFYKNFSINYNYSPQFEMDNLYIAGLHYFTIGYRF